MINFVLVVVGLIVFGIVIVCLAIVGAFKECEQDEDWIVYLPERKQYRTVTGKRK